MNREELGTLVRRAVEDPFTIHMTDGTSYDVKSPEMIAVGRHTAFVHVPNGEEADTYQRLSLIHIVRIEQKVPKNS